MIADIEIYRMAKRLIDHCGEAAPDHAYRMMRRFLAKNDPYQAGDWLAISSAIEDLQKLTPAAMLH